MSNWNQVKNGGKGSGRRAGANDDAYKSGWDRIFGEKNDSNKENNSNKKDNDSPK